MCSLVMLIGISEMEITYRLIDQGVVINTQKKDLDGGGDITQRRIDSDLYDGMDPLQLARQGRRVTWVEEYRRDPMA